MIQSKDRSGWFGASDTARITGNWDTLTFRLFWLEKLGLRQNYFSNRYTQAGTAYEHRILDSLGIPLQKDRQIKIRRLRLRVNLDGNTKTKVIEVKTYRLENGFKVSRLYWQQVQVEMFASGLRGEIVSYGLTEDDYRNFFNPIDKERLKVHSVDYDTEFINAVYLPRLEYLAYCLKKGVFPRESDV